MYICRGRRLAFCTRRTAIGFIGPRRRSQRRATRMAVWYRESRGGVQGAGVRGQASDVRSQGSEVRGQRSEVRGQRSEVRGQRSEGQRVRGSEGQRVRGSEVRGSNPAAPAAGTATPGRL